MLLLVTLSFAAEERWFYPGRGPERAVIDEQGRIGDMPVELTGEVVLRCDDPALPRGWPGVLRVEQLGGWGDIYRVQPAAGVDPVRLSRELHEAEGVQWAHPNLRLPIVAHALPDDPYVGEQWHLSNQGQGGWTPGADVGAETAWALATGAGGMVAVVDTGVDPDHPDLVVINGHDYVGDDEDSSPDPAETSAAHGTCAAGLAAAVGNNGVGVSGVARDATVYGIRFIGKSDLNDLYDAFVEATDAGAWVISNSWGFTSDCSAFPTYAIISDAVDYAEQQGRGGLGTAVVTSAGNGNCDASEDGFLRYDPVIGVAAINGDDHKESYSSFGTVVDIAAPAGGLLTTDISGEEGYGDYGGDPDYIGWFSGTSASAPVVSGVLLLMFEANPRLTVAQAREILCDTAVRVDVEGMDYDDAGWNPYLGCGRADAGAAVLAVADLGGPEQPGVLGPLGEVREDRVVLEWEAPADPDGDWLSYELRWWVEDGEPVVERLTDTHRELTGEVETGLWVSWTVRASDAWGMGEATEVQGFRVRATPKAPEPPAPQTCASGGRGSGLWALPGLLLLGLRRRRGR